MFFKQMIFFWTLFQYKINILFARNEPFLVPNARQSYFYG